MKGRPDFGEQKAKKQEENEVWLIDFGLAGKIRPALVVSVAFCDRDRALITVVPHATSLRGSPFGIATLQAQKRRPLRGEVRAAARLVPPPDGRLLCQKETAPDTHELIPASI